MKHHKIINVPIQTCTAEQKIAYNLAFRACSYRDNYLSARKISAICAADMLKQIKDEIFGEWCRLYGGKYNDDAIIAAFNAGLAKYLENPFIATGYEQIGNAFPAHYK